MGFFRYRTYGHTIKKQKPQGRTCGSCNKKEEKKNEKEEKSGVKHCGLCF